MSGWCRAVGMVYVWYDYIPTVTKLFVNFAGRSLEKKRLRERSERERRVERGLRVRERLSFIRSQIILTMPPRRRRRSSSSIPPDTIDDLHRKIRVREQEEKEKIISITNGISIRHRVRVRVRS